jgi:hypothetical protein
MERALNRELKYAFAIHVAKYMGIGLVSGSIVHAGTLGGNSYKYVGFILAGTVMTLLGYVLEYRQKNQPVGARILGLAVLLSFGTGMLSGGVQHYADNPAYGVLLLSIGLVITFLAMAYKDFSDLISFKFVPAALLVGGALYFALPFVNAMFLSNASDAGHSHADGEKHDH